MFSTEFLEKLPQIIQDTLQQALQFLPELWLVLGLIVSLLLDLILRKNTWAKFGILQIVSAIFLLAAWQQIYLTPAEDKLTFIAQQAIIATALLTFIVLPFSKLVKSLGNNNFNTNFKTEFYTIFLALCIGLLGLTRANLNLLQMYLFLEVSSISAYILTAWHFDKKAMQASLKYLLYGSVASGITLYGMSWLYGLTQSLELSVIIAKFQPLPLAYLALSFVLVGFLFKVSAFPLHIWAPDVYEAAPSPLVAFFSLAPKLAALLVLFRLGQLLDYRIMIVLSSISMLWGNLSALFENHLKRLLAYSAIAHAGLMLFVMYCPKTEKLSFAQQSILFYWVVYALGQIAIFLWIELMPTLQQKAEKYYITSYQGLGRTLPVMSILALLFMLHLTGLPPLGMFWGKLVVFSAIWKAYTQTQDIWWIVYLLVAVLNTAIALFYYLKLPYHLFFKPLDKEDIFKFSWLQNIGLILLWMFTLATFWLFFYPEKVLDWLS
ncbi:MAG: NADH-quinone oxidoreductase subunit N [Microscillaceae bacterium]|nr:NADH-quinone oxidoreductase subunit N [Microscillaceae bacterium]MDW8460894.1 NADH-quinone oxidoreductase subunit N [Cytophagales bacterium]